MYKFFAIFFLIGFCKTIYCQVDLEDVIYTREGSIYRGTILEQYPDSIKKIQIVGGSVIVCDASEVIEITKEEPFQNAKNKFSHPTGYFNATMIGVLIGDPDQTFGDPFLGVSFQTTNGYQIDPHFAVGVAASAESIGYQMINCMLYGQYNILKAGFSPYIYAAAGVNFPTYHEENAWQIIDGKFGSSTGAGVGFRFNSQLRIATTISFGYKRNSYSIETYDVFSQFQSTQFYIANRYLLQLGFTM